jgi:hypothetical protein
LGVSLKYAKERKAFGSRISDFGAIQHKLAEMAIRIYASESAAWRVVGLVQAQPEIVKAVEDYAIECSIIKVYGSEVLSCAVDEGVQIHGGYGFHQDYEVERVYRDARINRIFEGTNEINRLLITGMLLKRCARGQLDLSGAPTAKSPDGDEESRLVANAKSIALLMLRTASNKFKADLDKQQEIIMNISDIIMETFVMESSLLRTRKLTAGGKAGIAAAMTSVFLRDAMARIEVSARNVLGACSEVASMSVVRKLAAYDPVDAVTARRTIAARLLEREKFFV